MMLADAIRKIGANYIETKMDTIITKTNVRVELLKTSNFLLRKTIHELAWWGARALFAIGALKPCD